MEKVFDQIIQAHTAQQISGIETTITQLKQQIKMLQQEKERLQDKRKAIQHTIIQHQNLIKDFLLKSEILPYIITYNKITIKIISHDNIEVKITPTAEQKAILNNKRSKQQDANENENKET